MRPCQRRRICGKVRLKRVPSAGLRTSQSEASLRPINLKPLVGQITQLVMGSFMWAITSFYNPLHYKTRLSNYKFFRSHLKLPLVTVELSFDGEFELSKDDADVLIQISDGAILWQKERLLNVAIDSVPSNAKDVAWVDCDVVFRNADFAEEAAAKLKYYNAIQLFSDTIDLSNGDIDAQLSLTEASPTGLGVIYVRDADPARALTVGSGSKESRKIQKGLAWAAKRDILKKHGLYDALILGSADRAMTFAMFGCFDLATCSLNMNEARERHYLKWAEPFHRSVGGRIGYLNGRIYHLWHGDIENRGYADRHSILSRFNFDPETDLRIGANGAWQWARPRAEFQQAIVEYFARRAEDGAS